jgi:predicted PurR-regulated permease PerM
MAPESGAPRERRLVHLTASSAALIALSLLATLVIRNVFVSAHRIIGWAIACTIVAVLLAPPVAYLSRRMPRIVALLLVGAAIAVAVGVLVYGVFNNINDESVRLASQGVTAARHLEERNDRIGEIARDLRVHERATDLEQSIRDSVSSGGDALKSGARTVPTYFVCWILTIFLLLYGSRMVQGGLALIRDARKRVRTEVVLTEAVDNARGYVYATIAQGVLIGGLAWGSALLLDLPAPVIVGLLVGLMSMLPYIGITLGSIPFVLLIAGTRSALAAGVAVVLVLLLQAIEAFVVRPRVDGATLHVGPAVPVIVAVVGYGVYGVGGALYGAAIAVFLLAVADAAATSTETDIPTPLDPPEPSEDDDTDDADDAAGAQDAGDAHRDADAPAVTEVPTGASSAG